MTAELTPEYFTPHIGKRFRFEGTALVLRLAEVMPHAVSPAAAHLRQPFTLILHGPSTPVLAEGHYRVAIEDADTVDLYIIPIATRAGDRQDYQVAFN
jgi:uncharacterized protein DUF6916